MFGLRRALGLGHLAHFQRKLDVRAHALVRVQRIALEHHCHIALLGFDAIHQRVGDVHIATGGAFEASDDAQQRALAAPRWAEQHHELAVGDFEGNIVDGSDSVEDLGDRIETHGCHARTVGDGLSTHGMGSLGAVTFPADASDASEAAASAADAAPTLDLDGIERDLADVEQALARLDSGEYWRDEVTGAVLDDDLLEQFPTARRVPAP